MTSSTLLILSKRRASKDAQPSCNKPIAHSVQMTRLLSALRFAVLSAFLISLAACTPAPSCAPPAASMSVTELYFGRNIPGGGEVADADWRRFLDDVVTPRFPEGFTVLDGVGQYRMADGIIIRERSKVLVVIAKGGDAGLRLAEVVAEYKRRFRQESVMRRDGISCVSFP